MVLLHGPTGGRLGASEKMAEYRMVYPHQVKARMTILRMRLERERNEPQPNQKKIERMMTEYKTLERSIET